MYEWAREHGAGGQYGCEGTQTLAEDWALLHRDRMSEDTRKCRHAGLGRKRELRGLTSLSQQRRTKERRKGRKQIAKKGILGKQ